MLKLSAVVFKIQEMGDCSLIIIENLIKGGKKKSPLTLEGRTKIQEHLECKVNFYSSSVIKGVHRGGKKKKRMWTSVAAETKTQQ